jgi:hypothetical protein
MAMKTTGRIKRISKRRGHLPFQIIFTEEHGRKPVLAYGVKKITENVKKVRQGGANEFYVTEIVFRTVSGESTIWLHTIKKVMPLSVRQLFEMIEEKENKIIGMRNGMAHAVYEMVLKLKEL